MDLAFAVFVDHFDFAIGGKTTGAADVIDLVLLKEKFDAAGQLIRYFAGTPDHFVPVVSKPFEMESELIGAMGQGVIKLGVLKKRLCRDTAPVEAGAAGAVILDTGNFLPELCGTNGTDITAGAAANDNEIV